MMWEWADGKISEDVYNTGAKKQVCVLCLFSLCIACHGHIEGPRINGVCRFLPAPK